MPHVQTSTHTQRVQAAFYAVHNPDRTSKQIARKFDMSVSDLEKCVKRYEQGKLLKKGEKHWNPYWDSNDTLFHADDVYISNELSNGTDKKSTVLHGFFDSEYDSINGGMHYRWSESDVLDLLCSLPYRVLEILRDSEPGRVDYEEAVLFLDCELFTATCTLMGLDAEEIQHQALFITKAHI